jgi:hypothetical protein
MLKSKTFIGFCIVVFILMSSIMSFGATISYQYDDLYRLTRIENHSSFPCKRVTSATRRGENPVGIDLDSCFSASADQTSLTQE